MMLWIGFIVCSAGIVFCGYKLSRYGDIIAEKTGLGRTWIGAVLIATVTSLPELVTGLSSVTFAGVPNIAVGDVLGSCVFNMLILAVLDVLYRPVPISTKAHQGHILSAGLGILLIGIVGINMVLGSRLAPIGWISPSTFLVIAIYFAGIRMIYYYEKKRIASFIKERAIEIRYEHISMRSAAVNYAVNALGVIMASVFLPTIGAGLAEQTGLGQSFIGNILIAISTSLPEVVVSVSAVKIDAVDLAIGNLFGSNIFNLFILGLDDMFFTQGSLLAVAGHSHMISALSAIVMTIIAVIGLTYRAERKTLFLAWDSLGIVLMYIVNIMLLYMFR
jgi:cation:H+ antiporter